MFCPLNKQPYQMTDPQPLLQKKYLDSAENKGRHGPKNLGRAKRPGAPATSGFSLTCHIK